MLPDESNDHRVLEHALALAHQSLTLSQPNPRVGCVVCDAGGRVIGEGHTQRAGEAHAEIMALRDARSRGFDVRGATAYVTLEPCAHHGRTGPCCDALVDAGVSRVVAALEDPNPKVRGTGFARLRAAGVRVDVLTSNDPLAVAARELNIGFFSRMLRRRPWVRLKLAATLDGRTALPDGRSQWITGEAARADNQHWRARACAILTGSGTVLADDPRLDVRLPDAPRQPTLVLLDSRRRVAARARIFQAARPVWVYCDSAADQGNPVPGPAQLPAGTADRRTLPLGPRGLDLPRLLADLADREINELHVEAGPTLCGALVDAGLADELLLYLAPRLMGQGRPLLALGPLASLDAMPHLDLRCIDRIGADLRLRAYFAGASAF